MSLLSVAELQAQVETDFQTATLQQIIDAAEFEIDDYFGPITAYTYEFDSEFDEVLRLPVQGSSITSIEEYEGSESDPAKTMLASDDYELSSDGWDIRRLSDGTNPRSTWSWHVVVIFVPVSNVDIRKQVAIKLARCEIEHSAYGQESIGDWKAQQKNYQKEKVQILRQLNGGLIA